MSERVAIVVVHGMGNQFPMDTIRGFAAALKNDGETEYSSPNRITDETETRRLSFSQRPFDFYEYYWAHLVEEPGFFETMFWAVKLGFLKKPSKRAAGFIGFIRAFIILSLLGVVALSYVVYTRVASDGMELLKATFWGAVIVFLAKIIWDIISTTLAGSVKKNIGDVLKYTVPSPGNIATRDKIRKAGMALLRNLHEAKNEQGKFKYREIIVVGHSLGSVVAYDMLKNLFAQYHYKYSDIPDDISQAMLQAVKDASNNPVHSDSSETDYRKLQSKLFKEYRALGNEWRVTKFITLGSPLTHAPMLLARSDEDFQKQKEQREYPTSPPQQDADDRHFTYSKEYRWTSQGAVVKRNIRILHHAAHFAETQWTNIYFENDWVGGKLSEQFGAGIKDIAVKGERFIDRLPLTTHTKYWNPRYPECLKALIKNFEKEEKETKDDNE